MSWFARIFRRRDLYRDLTEEMRAHIEEKTEQSVREGMSREEAEHAARRAFGNAALIEERGREAWQWPRIESIWADMKYAIRRLLKSPGITLVAIITLALGLGASTAIFTLTAGIVLKSLPVPHPGRLVEYELRDGDRMRGLSGPLYKLLRERQTTSSDLMAWTNLAWMNDEKISVRSGSQSSLEDIQFLSGNSFRVLELEPYLGRGFSEQDESGSALPVIISYDYWRIHLASDPGVLGRTVTIADRPATIIGVMPAAFDGLTANLHPAVYLPLSATNIFLSKDETTALWPSHSGFYALGRLKPAATLKQAVVEAAAMEPSLRKEADPSGVFLAQFFKSLRLSVNEGSSGVSWLKSVYESPLLVLELLVALLLVLCSVNTALLMLARVSGRRQEYAVRAALGARRYRIVRQVLVETFLLALPGLALGIFVGWFGAHALASMLVSDGPPQPLEPSLNAVILSVNAGATLLIALGAAAFPAYRAAGIAPALDLKASERSVAAKHIGGWAIALQVAVSVCLVSTAVLLGDTLTRLVTAHSGFDFENAAAAEIDLGSLKLPEQQGNLLFQRFAAEVAAKPGVTASAFASPLPLYGHFIVTRAFSFDRQHRLHSQPSMSFAGITPGYFAAVGTHILGGDPAPQATPDANGTRNCVVSRSLAQSFFPGEDAIGQMIYFSTFGKPDGTVTDPKNACRVVSIAEDAKFVSLRRPAPEILYELFRLDVVSDFAPTSDGNFLVRAASDSLALAAVRSAIADTFPPGAIVKTQTFADRAHDDLSRERMLVLLSGSFAVLALLLTALGFYGLLMRSVTLRTREIGIRVALGAQRSAILVTVGRRIFLEAIAGLAAGTAVAVVLSQAIHRLLNIHSPLGVSGFLLAALLILAVTFLAVVPPARRAAKIDPMQALRSE
ncbi:MAG TPA: FtsX-like permease family protein [Silvibacterium sp.]|nr:FtsX-like permease family protein [Silvibacterium sp.]